MWVCGCRVPCPREGQGRPYNRKNTIQTSIRPQAVSPLKGDCLHKGNVAGTHFQTPFPTKLLAARKKLNPYYYRLNDGLSHGIGIGRLAPLLFERNVPKSGAHEAIAPTSRRYFRRKFWPHEKTKPLLILFKAWAFIWYRYCPASSVALREKCTESLCDMSLARTFRRHFRRKFWPHEKN